MNVPVALVVSGLAADLGYFDQAHFTKDFKATVGSPPNRYARAVTGPE